VRGACVALLALCSLLWASVACRSPINRGEYGRNLYQWSDASGAVRYTTYPERVPVPHITTINRVKAGRSAEENAALLPGSRTSRAADAASPATGDALDNADTVDLADLDRRIAELEVSVARDEEILKLLISDPEAAQGLRSSAELSEISKRLPARQSELRRLHETRARAADGNAP